MSDLDDAINTARGQKKTSQQNAPVSTNPNVVQSDPRTGSSVTVSTQTPLQKQIAADPYPTVDPNASIGEHLLSAGRQVLRGGENVARVGADAVTRGMWDKWSSDPVAARAKTEQASEELGTGGNLGIRTITSIPGRIFRGGGLLKAGIEGGINGAVDAYGHGGSTGDVLLGGVTGFGTGSGLSGAGQVISAGARKLYQNPQIANALKTATEKFGNFTGITTPPSPSDVTQKLKQDADVKFRQLDQNTYHAPHVGNVADTVDQTLLSDPVTRSASPGTNDAIQRFRKDIWDKAANGQSSSAGDIHTVIKSLNRTIAGGGFDGGQAAQARDQFTQALGRLPTTNGAPASAVVEQFNQANAAHGLFKNAEALQNMNENLGTYGSMPGPTAKKMVEDNPQFYNPDQTAALNKIANSGEKPSNWPFATTGATGAGWAAGHPGWGALAGGSIDAMKYLATPAGARRAVYNAYPAMTGQTVMNPEEMTSEALKRIGIGGLSAEGTPNPVDMTPAWAKPWVMPYVYGQ